MNFTRLDVVNYLHNRGFSIVDEGYRAQVEKYILFRFDLLEEELVDRGKKFRSYCSLLASKVKGFYLENNSTFERMIDDDSHKVVSQKCVAFVHLPHNFSCICRATSQHKSRSQTLFLLEVMKMLAVQRWDLTNLIKCLDPQNILQVLS